MKKFIAKSLIFSLSTVTASANPFAPPVPHGAADAAEAAAAVNLTTSIIDAIFDAATPNHPDPHHPDPHHPDPHHPDPHHPHPHHPHHHLGGYPCPLCNVYPTIPTYPGYNEQLIPAPNNPGYYIYPSNPGQLYYYPNQQRQQEQLIPAPNNPGYYIYPSNPGQLYYYPNQQVQPPATAAPPPQPSAAAPNQSVNALVSPSPSPEKKGTETSEKLIEHPDKPGHYFYPSNNKQLYVYVMGELVPLEAPKKEKLIPSPDKPGYYYYPSNPEKLIKPD